MRLRDLFTSMALVVLLVAAALAMSCRANPVTAPVTQRSASAALTTSAIMPVRVIRDGDTVVARPGGGPLAFTILDAAGDVRAFELSSWDASPPVPLGRAAAFAWVTATRDGVIVMDHRSLSFVSWSGARETTLTALNKAYFAWASPSGSRLLVAWNGAKGKPPQSIVVRDTGYVGRTWAYPKSGIGNAIWTSDTRYLAQLDTETDEGFGPIVSVSVTPDGGTVTSDTGLEGTCPAPNPSGSVWAYCDGNHDLVLYDPSRRRTVATWDAPRQWTGGPAAEVDAWPDASHVVVPVTSEDGVPSLWVVDVAAALRRYSTSR